MLNLYTYPEVTLSSETPLAILAKGKKKTLAKSN